MPCLTPYRGDTSQMLLFKIASCLEASGGGGVTSFNGLTGAVTFTGADIIALLGCTPACEGDVVNSFNTRTGDVTLTLADVSTVADARYVLKAGDTMTGALAMPAGSAALPSNTFSGDLDTGMYSPGADSVGFSTGGTLRLTVATSAVTSTVPILAPDGTAALPGYAFSGDTNTGIYRIGADILGFSTAGTARWQISAAGHFLATTDNAYSIGASGANRPSLLFVAGAGTFGGDVISGGASGYQAAAGSFFFWVGRARMSSPGLGQILIDDGLGSFNRLQFGGTTSAFPSIKRVGATLQFRLADDSAFAAIATAGIVMSVGAPLSITSGANQRAGDAVFVAGTVTVANTTVTANTRVFVSRKTIGGTAGTEYDYTLIAATSFTINSNIGTDTSTISYLLVEVP